MGRGKVGGDQLGYLEFTMLSTDEVTEVQHPANSVLLILSVEVRAERERDRGRRVTDHQ